MGLCSLQCPPLHPIHSIPHPRSCIIFILQPTLAKIQDNVKYYEKCKSYVCSASFYQVFNFSILSRMKSAMSILDKIGRFMTGQHCSPYGILPGRWDKDINSVYVCWNSYEIYHGDILCNTINAFWWNPTEYDHLLKSPMIFWTGADFWQAILFRK